jgi:hypothetical protein
MSQGGVVVSKAAGEVAKRGPKTPAGKLAVSRNASKHGILSPKPVVAHFESEDGWETHRQSILDSLEPQGGIEQAFAERVALNSWRLNRVIFYETEQISKLQESAVAANGGAALKKVEEAEKARAIYDDIALLYEDRNADSAANLGSHLTSDWFYEEAPYCAAILRAYQDAETKGLHQDEIDEDAVQVNADALEDVLRKHTGSAFLLTVSQMREAIKKLAEEVGLEDSIGVDGTVAYTPAEWLLERIHTEARTTLTMREEQAREVEEKILNKRRERVLPFESDLQKISRYEAHLSREMYKALHELEALQTRRQGGAAPLARVDVEIP